MARADEGYADADEEMAPPGVSEADLVRGAELEREPSRGPNLDRRETWDREAELEHNRNMFGVTYRERRGPRHRRCINYCLQPGQRTAKRCPTCYGRVETRPMDEDDESIEPGSGRRERFWQWVGMVGGHIMLGMSYPWRLDRARMRELLEEELAESVLRVDLICPVCAAAEEKQKEEASGGK